MCQGDPYQSPMHNDFYGGHTVDPVASTREQGSRQPGEVEESMNEGQESQKWAQARERREVHEVQEGQKRAQARERVRAAQERERQERQHRPSRSQERTERRARAALTRPASETPRDG